LKILVVLSRVPYPLEKGDKLRAFNQIKELSKKHEIILFALNDSVLHPQAIDELKKYCVAISVIKFSKITIFFNLFKSFFNGLPFQVGYFYFSKAQSRIDVLIAKHKPDHIYCQLIRTTEYVKKHSAIPKTLDYMDVFSKGIERRMKSEPFYLKPFFKMEFKRLLRYENKIFDFFKNKTIISEQDKNFIPHIRKEEIVVTPNGVDIDYFKPIVSEKKYDLLFNGNMNYPPNIESAEYLVKKIMPIVWESNPGIKLLISGADPHKRVLNLASDRVIVSGFVEDVRASYAQSKILVAPMQISIGLQNKLLEAMAMRLPCITSSLANNAVGAIHNQEIMVADTPNQYAGYVLELLDNEDKYKLISVNGYKFTLNKYNWKNTVAILDNLISKK
jgi:sugar transferase (PEP-CTERM/EpsH1 system associated)